MATDAPQASGSPDSRSPPTEAMPSSVAGRYRIERLLGKGGFGRVYLAQHVNTGEHVALKLLSEKLTEPEFIERFKREMRAPAQIRSGHVVRVLDADVAPELNGAPFFVMELLSGKDLHQRIKEAGPLSADGVVWVIGQIAKALSRAHDLGLIHRDLKPENIYLHQPPDAPAMVKLLDFGLVHSVQSAPPPAGQLPPEPPLQQPDLERAPTLAAPPSPNITPRLTATGAMLGTPLYMAPEQIDSVRAETGPATDIWALGMIAFELLVGRSYWPEASPMRVYANILAGRLVPPSERSQNLPPRFDEWFARACAMLPAERFPNVNAQAQALAAALDVAPQWLQRLEPPWSRSDDESPVASGAELSVEVGISAGNAAGPGRRSLGSAGSSRREAVGPATARINRRNREGEPEANRGKRSLFVLLVLLLVIGAGLVLRGAMLSTRPPPPVSPPSTPEVPGPPEPLPSPPEPPVKVSQPEPPASIQGKPSPKPKGSHPRKHGHSDPGGKARPRGEYVPAAP